MKVEADFTGQMTIGDFPDAIKVIEVPGENAKLLGDLTLHQSDLLMAARCLATLEALPPLDQERLTIISSALWRQAVSLIAKCFGKDARCRLDPDRIYADTELRNSLQFFIDLRNKVFLHDANAYTQRQVLAPINAGTKPNKVEAVIAINAFFDVRGPENQRLLHKLIEQAQAWVAHEFDSLRDAIKEELEQWSYESLTNLPPAQIRVPTVDEMGKDRRRKLADP